MTTTPLPPLPRGIETSDYLGNPVMTYSTNQMETFAAQACANLEAELSAHKAARLAYASEFPPNEDGDPDVGSIHQNIRILKAENKRLREALEAILDEQNDNEGYAKPATYDAARSALENRA